MSKKLSFRRCNEEKQNEDTTSCRVGQGKPTLTILRTQRRSREGLFWKAEHSSLKSHWFCPAGKMTSIRRNVTLLTSQGWPGCMQWKKS